VASLIASEQQQRTGAVAVVCGKVHPALRSESALLRWVFIAGDDCHGPPCLQHTTWTVQDIRQALPARKKASGRQ